MSSREIGVAVIVLGVLLLVLGALFYSGALGWLGRVPGDLHFERGRTRIFVPIGSMIVLSIVLSLLFTLFRRFL